MRAPCKILPALALAALALPALSAVDCQKLDGARIAPSAIGLPTRGARLDSVTVVRATAGTPEYCRVLGSILPVDSAAPVIQFQVNLPLVWNQKSMQFGGGGYDGSLVTGEGQVAHALIGSSTPLQRGYVTYGSDSGHAGSGSDGRFALNEEALRNFTGESIKKLRDVAQQLMLMRYGQGPLKSYFQGGSSGGREAMAAIQRWPGDYDGVVAHYPALQFTGLELQANRIMKALYAPGGFVDTFKMNHLNAQVVAACDALDGAVDGLIHNVAACRYDPAVLRCHGNIDWGPTCLTDAQLNTVRTIATPIELGFPLANGLRSGPAYPILSGANFGGPINVGWLGVPLDPAVLALNGYAQVMQAQWVKYFITGDANFDPQTFDPQTGGRWQARVQQVSAWHDATSTDLTAFMQRGGKLLILHGTSDTIVSPNGTIDYVKALQQRYGDATLRSFMRFYTVAGFGHGIGRYQATWNALDLLEAWAEHGREPVNPTSTDALNLLGRSRPLCEYPAFPRYVGGWVESASSFRCALQ